MNNNERYRDDISDDHAAALANKFLKKLKRDQHLYKITVVSRDIKRFREGPVVTVDEHRAHDPGVSFRASYLLTRDAATAEPWHDPRGTVYTVLDHRGRRYRGILVDVIETRERRPRGSRGWVERPAGWIRAAESARYDKDLHAPVIAIYRP